MTELSKRYEVVGALTYYLYDYGMIEPEKIYTVVQGEKMQRPSKISTQLILMFKELNEFFAEIKQEAAEFAESFRSNPRMLEAHMNDIKNRLSAKVSDMFGIEYHYTISSVDFFRGGEVAHAQGREYLCGNPQGERPEPSGAQACAPETGTGGRIDNTSTNIKISRYTFSVYTGVFCECVSAARKLDIRPKSSAPTVLRPLRQKDRLL
jgi:hypothetical protein